MDELGTTIAATVASTIIIGVGASLYRKLQFNALDRRRVYRWLCRNTQDEPGESHTGTTEIGKGTRLPEERVRLACMSDKRIYRGQGEKDRWSVWRHDPESVYERQGVFTV